MTSLSLAQILDQQTRIKTPDALIILLDVLRKKHGDSINSILFYGSCLRNGNIFEGLVDLYLIVDDYSSFYTKKRLAFANWLLPPNVFYIEIPTSQETIRCKYAILSSHDFERGTQNWFHSYLWGRFTQPVAIVYSKNKAAHKALVSNLATAISRFLSETLPCLPAEGSVRSLWERGLQLSYHAELRTESGQRAITLIDDQPSFYAAITYAAQPSLPIRLNLTGDAITSRYKTAIPSLQRTFSRISWQARKFQGKLLSVLRLLKALFTFEGGLDYIAWKLERHSGQKVEIPDRVRRYPLIFIWGLFWRLYRRGIFR
jgi:hypothetical protein